MRRKKYNSEKDFYYSYDGRVLTVTGPVDRNAAELHIPPVIDGHEVGVIGNGAFQFCHGLKRISVPDTVTGVENSAFKGCENLTDAELSASLTSIGALAFQGCVSLKHITVSNHTDRVEMNSFRDCRAIEMVHVKLRETADTSPHGDTRTADAVSVPAEKGGRRAPEIYHGLYESPYKIRSFAVASESDEAVWLYLRSIMSATDANGGYMAKYDANFLEIRGEDDMYRVAAFRLSDPYNMTRRMYKIYRDSLTGMIDSIIKADRVDRLTKLGELGCIDNELLPGYIDMAGRIGGGCIAYLLEHQNRYAKAGENDFSL